MFVFQNYNNTFCYLDKKGNVFYDEKVYHDDIERHVLYNIHEGDGMKRFIEDIKDYGARERSNEIRKFFKQLIG